LIPVVAIANRRDTELIHNPSSNKSEVQPFILSNPIYSPWSFTQPSQHYDNSQADLVQIPNCHKQSDRIATAPLVQLKREGDLTVTIPQSKWIGIWANAQPSD